MTNIGIDYSAKTKIAKIAMEHELQLKETAEILGRIGIDYPDIVQEYKEKYFKELNEKKMR